eukprot:SAG31_NODE_4059_length_3630_cov_2.094308_7_plen_78_part_00
MMLLTNAVDRRIEPVLWGRRAFRQHDRRRGVAVRTQVLNKWHSAIRHLCCIHIWQAAEATDVMQLSQFRKARPSPYQ